MIRSNFKLRIIILSLTWLILSHLFFDTSVVHADIPNVPKYSITGAEVTISASIGEPALMLWGYSSPDSRIEISGDRISDFTYSKPDGYYEFTKVYLPTPSDLFYPEICITAIDTLGRSTPPTCIPPLPLTGFSYNIGPVILPPTLSLTDGAITPSSQSGASGTTIPNSEVKIVLAEDGSLGLNSFEIIGKVHAFYLPNYIIKSDNRGYFSFNMPNSSPNNWRVFAITNYTEGATSPKSNTLKYIVVSPTLAALSNFWRFLLSLLTLPILIIIEVIIILIVITMVILSKKRHRKVSPNIVDPVKQYQEYLKSSRTS